jgi:hypothetical protein
MRGPRIPLILLCMVIVGSVACERSADQELDAGPTDITAFGTSDSARLVIASTRGAVVPADSLELAVAVHSGDGPFRVDVFPGFFRLSITGPSGAPIAPIYQLGPGPIDIATVLTLPRAAFFGFLWRTSCIGFPYASGPPSECMIRYEFTEPGLYDVEVVYDIPQVTGSEAPPRKHPSLRSNALRLRLE